MANAMHAYSTNEIKVSIERLKRLYSVAGEGQRLNNSDDLRSCSLAGQFHYYGFFFFLLWRSILLARPIKSQTRVNL